MDKKLFLEKNKTKTIFSFRHTFLACCFRETQSEHTGVNVILCVLVFVMRVNSSICRLPLCPAQKHYLSVKISSFATNCYSVMLCLKCVWLLNRSCGFLQKVRYLFPNLSFVAKSLL